MQEIAHHDFAFENIVSELEQQLQILAEKLQLQPKVCLMLNMTGVHKSGHGSKTPGISSAMLWGLANAMLCNCMISDQFESNRTIQCKARVYNMGNILQSDWGVVVERINALKPPAGGPPDPVTKLWPRHLSKEVMAEQQGRHPHHSRGSNSKGHRSLKERFSEYFRLYGYD